MLYLGLGGVAAMLLVLDQWLKYWITANLPLGESMPFLPGFIEFLTVHNYGAAWSSFSGQRWLLLGVTAVLICAVLYAVARRIVRHPLGLAACALILSGGIGNLIDRIRLGYVVDMFHLEFWPTYPVFNVADICVVVGALIGAVYYLWIYEKYDAVRKEDGEPDAPSES
jgi:signal peptidase II